MVSENSGALLTEQILSFGERNLKLQLENQNNRLEIKDLEIVVGKKNRSIRKKNRVIAKSKETMADQAKTIASQNQIIQELQQSLELLRMEMEAKDNEVDLSESLLKDKIAILKDKCKIKLQIDEMEIGASRKRFVVSPVNTDDLQQLDNSKRVRFQ